MELEKIELQLIAAAEELITIANPQKGQVFVVGCSTSEVVGSKIGTAGSMEAAEIIFRVLQEVANKHELFLAVQCCEHLNRALVTETAAAEKYGWEEVGVRPVRYAGGALATIAYANFTTPIVVEKIVAHLGLDIGQTLIGMHLKRVAVPVRLAQQKIGDAILTAARTRPPLIGGERAVYK
ncbi:hypothetical protein SDC9_22503 [bioreactor metagenome]|jgi:TIGR01440 family protein|uniref:Uncharacterized protein n=1 Tax=bioreactor metagenome TaxID=1076179 RepID=A0A644UCK9_9ZZZZ|nr:TIGR01440 family protein [Acidaminococcaceae bacterium]NLU43487.1 TIGR01440 family protein [Acholeplasmataceae bacterium]